MTRRAVPPLEAFDTPPRDGVSSESILAALVAFDSVSSASNLPLIEWIARFLASHGIASQRFLDASGTKASLHAVIGPADRPGGVVLSGHTDVVPVVDQVWGSDPFVLHAEDDLLFGRGACDMKGFIACVLARVPQMCAAPLRAPIHFAFSYDEEVGCLGVDALIATLRRAPALDFCVVGEPTMMKPVTGHKGVVNLRCTVKGREAHSSQAPSAVNAVEAAAELSVFVRSLSRRMAEEGPYNTHFDPPFTTMQTSVLRGGTAVNIVPNQCEIDFDIRPLPGVDVAALVEDIRQHAFRVIEPRMKAIDPGAGFTFQISAQAAGFDIDHAHPAVAAIQAMTGANETEKVSFASEAGLFQAAGIPTVVCGPGSILQAHKPDEYVSRRQLRLCEQFLDRLIARQATLAIPAGT